MAPSKQTLTVSSHNRDETSAQVEIQSVSESYTVVWGMSVNKDNNLFGFGWIFIADGYAIDPDWYVCLSGMPTASAIIATDDPHRCIGFTLIYRNSNESSNQSMEIFIRIGGVDASEAKAYQQINLFSAPRCRRGRREARGKMISAPRRTSCAFVGQGNESQCIQCGQICVRITRAQHCRPPQSRALDNIIVSCILLFLLFVSVHRASVLYATQDFVLFDAYYSWTCVRWNANRCGARRVHGTLPSGQERMNGKEKVRKNEENETSAATNISSEPSAPLSILL